MKKLLLILIFLAIDSGQNLNWQTPDIMGGKE